MGGQGINTLAVVAELPRSIDCIASPVTDIWKGGSGVHREDVRCISERPVPVRCLLLDSSVMRCNQCTFQSLKANLQFFFFFFGHQSFTAARFCANADVKAQIGLLKGEGFSRNAGSAFCVLTGHVGSTVSYVEVEDFLSVNVCGSTAIPAEGCRGSSDWMQPVRISAMEEGSKVYIIQA